MAHKFYCGHEYLQSTFIHLPFLKLSKEICEDPSQANKTQKLAANPRHSAQKTNKARNCKILNGETKNSINLWSPQCFESGKHLSTLHDHKLPYKMLKIKQYSELKLI